MDWGLADAIEALDKTEHQSFLRGYRLSVATPLYSLLSSSINQPTLLGLKEDLGLYHWLNYGSSRHGGNLLAAASDLTCDVGKLCCLFIDLFTALRTGEPGLPDTIACLEKCRGFAVLLREGLAQAEITRVERCEKLSDGGVLIAQCVGERILDYVEYERGIVPLARDYVWGSSYNSRPLVSSFAMQADTHLDPLLTLPFFDGVPHEWIQGLRFGFDLALRLSGISLPTHSDTGFRQLLGQQWFDELLALVKLGHGIKSWPSEQFEMKEFLQAPFRTVLEQIEVSMPTVSSKQRLAAILSPDTVQLVSSTSQTDALQLRLMMTGATVTLDGSKLRLLLLTHSVSADQRKWVSVAIRIPIYGTIMSNSSRWYLFYKMYHIGFAVDSDVTRASAEVSELLREFGGRLEVEKLDRLGHEDLLVHCELPAFRAMRELSHTAVETNAKLRGGSSELLGAFWLTCRGYTDVKVSFRHDLLGKSDYDAIGVKEGNCLTLEVKGGALSNDNLDKRITKFADKIRKLRRQMPALSRILGCESTIDSVSGLFIFLGEIDEFTPTDTSVQLWGYDDFVEVLRTANLPRRIISLLDRGQIIRNIRLDAFPDDPFFVGLQDFSS